MVDEIFAVTKACLRRTVAHALYLLVQSRRGERKIIVWRAKPLLKLFTRAFAYSAVTEVVLGALLLFIFISGFGILGPDPPLLHMLLINALASMLSVALTLALPMTLVTALCFREIRRPKFYRFAMLTVALVTSILVWPGHFEGMGGTLQSNAPAEFKAFDAVHILTHALAIFSAQLAAGKYLREFLAARHPAKQS